MGLRMCFASVLVVIGACTLAPAPASGQDNRPETSKTGKVPVVIAVISDWSYGSTPAVILRQKDQGRRDVVLLDSARATDEDLSEAIYALLAIRAVRGDYPDQNQVLRARAGSKHSLLIWTRRMVAGLKRSPPTPLEGFGRLPHVTVWLPPQAMRQASKPR